MRASVKWGIVGLAGVAAAFIVAWILWPVPAPPGQTRTAVQEGVTVVATLAPGDELRFTVVLDTHTVDLSGYDPVAKARLETAQGILRPAGTSRLTDNTGHHVEAHLVFSGPRTGAVTLVLEDLAGVSQRRLEFDE